MTKGSKSNGAIPPTKATRSINASRASSDLPFDATDIPAGKMARFAYCAFGSNLHRAQMAFRCPDAKPLDSGRLLDFKLIFRRVADVIYSPGNEVPVGLWNVTAKCVRSLDHYEGFPRLYVRRFVTVFTETGPVWAFVYVMRNRDIEPPTTKYFNTIRAGYEQFGLPIETLHGAHKHAVQTSDEQRRKSVGRVIALPRHTK